MMLGQSSLNYLNDRSAAGNELLKEQGHHWQTVADADLSRRNLESLFNNKLPTIRIRNFASTRECRALAQQVQLYATFQGYTFEKLLTTF